MALRLAGAVVALAGPLAAPALAMPGGLGGGLFGMGFFTSALMLLAVVVGYLCAWAVTLYKLAVEQEGRSKWTFYLVCLSVIGLTVIAVLSRR